MIKTKYSLVKMLIAFSIIAVGTFLVIFNNDKFSNSLACSDLSAFKNSKIIGVVNGKYIDSKNHNAPTVMFKHGDIFVLPLDTCPFYNFIEHGDSITKPLNTDTIRVFRKGEIHRFKIYFGCEDNE